MQLTLIHRFRPRIEVTIGVYLARQKETGEWPKSVVPYSLRKTLQMYFFLPKNGNTGNGACTFESTWNTLWMWLSGEGRCTGVHSISRAINTALAISFWKGSLWSGTVFVRESSSCPCKKMRSNAMQSYMKQPMIVPYRIEQLQGGYRHSEVAEC